MYLHFYLYLHLQLRFFKKYIHFLKSKVGMCVVLFLAYHHVPFKTSYEAN